MRIDAIDGDTIISISCRIIERLLRKGDLEFESLGISSSQSECIVQSVEHEAMQKYGHFAFLKPDIVPLLRQVLFIFLTRNMALVPTSSQAEPQRQQQKSILIPTTASLH